MTAITRAVTSNMSWWEATKIYFGAHPKAKVRWLAMMSRLALVAIRWVPALAFIIGVPVEDVTSGGIGILDDPFFLPLLAWNLFGIYRIHHTALSRSR